MHAWWERWPELYKREIGRFAERCAHVEELFKARSILVLEVAWPLNGRDSLRLRIGFSPLHPFCRVSVSAPDESFGRHQNPIEKTLCLLPDEPGQWNPNELVADFIHERVEHLLETLEAHSAGRIDEVRALEEHAPDPLMPYYQHAGERGSVILFDGNLSAPVAGVGLANLTIRLRPHRDNTLAFEGTLHALDAFDSRSLGRFDVPAPGVPGEKVLARWVRAVPPKTDDPRALLDAADAAIRSATALDARAIRQLSRATANPSITIFVFPDEKIYGDLSSGVGLVFIVGRPPIKARGEPRLSVVRAEAVSRDMMFARSPIAASLRSKRVLVVGCGAIGSFAAAELARSGVGTLALWDGDHVTAGNSVRWLLGRPAWGQSKTDALLEFLQQNYPLCSLVGIRGRVGGASADPASVENENQNPLEMLAEQIRLAHVIVDATGSTEVQQALSFLCRETGKPYVVGYGTLGVAGGMVAAFPAAADACFVCLSESWTTGALLPLAEDVTGVVTPAGCNSITFTGASFDLQEISLQMARWAVDLLADAHPAQATLASLRLRDENGNRILPHWSHDEIKRHDDCSAHT